jgi:hypothetical protein
MRRKEGTQWTDGFGVGVAFGRGRVCADREPAMVDEGKGEPKTATQHNTTQRRWKAIDRQVDRHTVVVQAGKGISWWYRETKPSGIDQSIPWKKSKGGKKGTRNRIQSGIDLPAIRHRHAQQCHWSKWQQDPRRACPGRCWNGRVRHQRRQVKPCCPCPSGSDSPPAP